MSENPSKNHIVNICAIVEERDKKLCEMDAKCKYYKDMIETDTAEIKVVQKDIRRIHDENEEAEKQLEKTEFILKSLRENQNVLTESVINHHTLEKMLVKKLEAKQAELPLIEKEFRDLYERSRSKMTDNPLFKELEKAKVKFRKTNIELRDLKVQIARKKLIIAEKQAIQKKRYYAFFIRMAEDYMVDKKMKELQELKEKKLIAIKKVAEYQASLNAKKKQAMSKMENFKNIIFANETDHIEKPPKINNKPLSRVLKQQQPLQRAKAIPNLRERLNKLKEEEEVDPVEIPRKVRIIEQVVAPAMTAPNFSKTLQRLVKTTGSKTPSFPQLDKSIAIQSGQQSELGQLSQGTKNRDSAKMITPVMATLPQLASPERRKTRVINFSKKWQSMIKIPGSKDELPQQTEDSEMFQLSQHSDLEQTSQQSQSADETTSFPVENIGSKTPNFPRVDKSIAIQSGQQSELGQLSQETKNRDSAMITPVMTKLPQFASPERCQRRVIKLPKKWQSMIKISKMNQTKDELSQQTEDSEMSQLSQHSDLEQLSQQSRSADKTTSFPVVSDQSMPKLPINQKPILIATELKNQNNESSASRNVAESNKSVKFNVESKSQKPKESSGMFSQAMFENPFQSYFFDKKADNTADSKQTEELMSNLSKDDFNNTGADFNNSASVFNFYEDISDQDDQFSTAETGPFGGDNMFSFGLNKPLFPFQ